MAACFGRWPDLDHLANAVFTGAQIFEPDPASGGFVSPPLEFQVDLQELGLSPDEFDRLAPDQLIALSVAGRALKDAGYSLEDDLPRIAVVSPNIGYAQLVSDHWALSGPQRPAEGGAGWVAAGLAQAQSALDADEAEAILFIGVNGPSSPAASSTPVSSPSAAQIPTLRIDLNQPRPIPTSGAAAILVKPADLARQSGDRVYAVLEGWSDPGKLTAVDAIRSAWSKAGRTPSEANFLEVTASGEEAPDLPAVFLAGPEAPSIALGSFAPNLGDAGSAAGLAGLIHAALAVYHRLIPGVPAWQGVNDPAAWQSTPFYVPGGSRPWFIRSGQEARNAGVDLGDSHRGYAHIVVSRAEDRGERANPFLPMASTHLLPVAGDDLAGILAALDGLQAAVESGAALKTLARQAYQAFSGVQPLALALIAGSPADLLREIDFARKGLPKAVEKGTEWQTPSGSYFTSQPAGPNGGVAFVYPGAFNSFVGLGKDLFDLFPTIYPRFSHLTQDIGAVLRERSLYPRSLAALSQKDLDELETALSQDPIAMLTSGTSLAVLYTYVLRHVFGVHPRAAFGYSLGETSMMYALEVWSDGDGGNAALSASPVFHRRLAGPKETVREAWGLPTASDAEPGEPLWSNLLLMTTPEAVREQIQAEPRVYLTHINTPRQVVIAGDPVAVRRVADRLGCPALQAPFDHVLHCDPVRLEFEHLAGLNDFPVQPNTETALYSAAAYAPVRFEQAEIARDIAETLCSCLDFPRLVNRVYADGSRVFVEVGAGSNCARWVDEILKGSPHLAVSVSRKGSDDLSALLRTLARLVSHCVNLDLSPLYAEPFQDRSTASLLRTIRLGPPGAGER
jgi:PfaB family protein